MAFVFVATIMPHQRVRRPQVWLYAVGTVAFLALFVFLNVGRWLVVEDPLRKASAIAVLSGALPGRAVEAARIYRQGYAPRVWLTYSAEPRAALAKYSVHFRGEEQYNKEVLIHEGVPENAIEVLGPPIENTADEMRTIGNALEKEEERTVILVTSKVHTRRVRTLWKRLAPKDGVAMVRGVSDDPYDAAHWWTHTRDALDVVREVLGLLNAWAGLPLKPTG